MATPSEEGSWFEITVLLILLVVLIMAVITAIYFNKIRSGNNITSSDATVLLWLNIIIAILVLIIILWALWRLLYPSMVPSVQATPVQLQTAPIPPSAMVNPPQPTGVFMTSTSGAESQNVLLSNAAQQVAGAQG